MKTQLDRITDQHQAIRKIALAKLLWSTVNRGLDAGHLSDDTQSTWAFNLAGMRVTGHAWRDDGEQFVRATVNQRGGIPDYSRPFHPSDFRFGDAFALAYMDGTRLTAYPDEFFCRADCLMPLAKAKVVRRAGVRADR
jgi:hypothetical protein